MTGAPPAPPPTPTPEPNAPRSPRRFPWICGATRTRRSSRCRRCARRRIRIATTARSPPVGQAVRAARDAGSAERQSGRRSESRDRHVRPAVSAGSLVGSDLQRRVPRRSEDGRAPQGARSHAAAASTMSPGGKYLLFFDEDKLNWFTQDIATGVRVNLTERLPVKFYDEGHDTPERADEPRHRRLDRRRQVGAALRPVRHLGNPAGRHERRATSPAARAASSISCSAYTDAARRRRRARFPTDKPMLLTTTNDDTKATGYYRVPFTGGAPEKIVDDGQGDGRHHARRRTPTWSCSPSRGSTSSPTTG